MDYKKAGVDIEAGYRAVELMKEHVQSTLRPEVLGGLGGFSGAFSLASFAQLSKPVLLSGTDGVGTKLKLAFIMDKHDTVGIDCVAMCVNDVACAGGEPLFFLDYIACGKNLPERIASLVKGVAQGCKEAGAALIGGETAEMPGFYPEDEYDLAGFAVGIADESQLITGQSIADGDILVGIASSGVHSNGFSLIRQIFPMTSQRLNTYEPLLEKTLGEALLCPTKIYVKTMKAIKEAGVTVKGCSHITGGGFYENIPRMLPDNITAVIRKGSYPIPPIFDLIQKEGEIQEEMMYNTYNMGIGMMLALSPKDVSAAMEAIRRTGEQAYEVGVCRANQNAAKSQKESICFE
ncbi:MAG: phosphoribosylformylglycinamidine cyclo-ligase [Lachnospiraceae bacterium]|jgi:phosphoribosylformylglycinamidine cyclo-ligase|nr:phosphoribosylformylglycinamidine cyclo-ligase [Lachnospiraceae bacterium]